MVPADVWDGRQSPREPLGKWLVENVPRGTNLRAQARRAGRTVDLGDVLVAGIAKTHDLTLVTCNIDHFHALDVEVVNPWEAS